MKVLAACGSGMGSSQIIKMKLDKIFKKLGITPSIHHCSVGEAKGLLREYDVVITSEALVSQFADKEKVIGIKNLLADKEIEEKLTQFLNSKK